MATTMQQCPQRFGERAQHIYSDYIRATPTGDTLPTGRYAEDGDFYLDFPPDLHGGEAYAQSFRRVVALNMPPGMIDYEEERPNPGAMWVHWQYGPRIEAIAKMFWPGLPVAAAKNPRYQQGGELAQQLQTMRQALVAAEASVRCGVAFGGGR